MQTMVENVFDHLSNEYIVWTAKDKPDGTFM